MPNIEETSLPGVGLRYEFTTNAGERVCVVSHRTGRRDVFVYDLADPDAARHALNLDEEESHALAELLGGSRITQNISHMLQQSIEGLTIDWLSIDATWACAGHTIAESMLRTKTGVSVVAIVRGTQTIPSPTPEVHIAAGDTVVAVGTPEGLRRAARHLQHGEP